MSPEVTMIRLIDSELLEVFYQWCDAHGFPKMPTRLLPKRAFMAFLGEKPVITGFLYKDETADFCFLEWIVANPDSTHEERSQAFADLIKHIRQQAKESGVVVIFTTAKSSHLEQRLVENGFNVTDREATHFIGEV